MVRLSPRDYELVITLLPTLYAPAEPAEFMRHSLHFVRALIPAADAAAWIGFHIERAPKLDTWIATDGNARRDVIDRMQSGLATHPFTRNFGPAAASRVLKLSDYPKSVRDRHKDEFDDVYRALELRDGMMAIVELNGGGALGVTLNQKTRDFAERDRTVLTLIRAHLRRAHENARLLSRHARSPEPTPNATERFGLTARESDVAFWVSHGKTNAEIAMILRISRRTVEKHVEAVLRKLRVENRTTAAVVLSRT